MVTVIDSPCGSGKTSWAIEEINRNTDRNYVVCTPFLDEITRYRGRCEVRDFTEPTNYGTTKIDDFNSRLEAGENIVVTHSTFLNATRETVDFIRNGNYHLILDEALDVVVEFNKTGLVEGDVRQQINEDDLDILFDKNMIQVDPETNQVQWIDRNSGNSKYSAVERMAKGGRLYLVRGRLLVCVFPPEMFRVFRSVTAMTYLFGGSQMKAYFDLHDIDYVVKSVEATDGGYRLCDYNTTADVEFKHKIRPLVTVVDNPELNLNYNLSMGWYDDPKRRTQARTKALKSHVTHFFKNIAKASATREEIMWTCPSKYEEIMAGERYTGTKKIVPQCVEHETLLKKAKKDSDDFSKHLKCFIPCNSKGTNDFRFRWALAYLCDISYNSMTSGFFLDRNEERRSKGLSEITLDNDLLALSCLIQWMFRSRIRDGKPIHIYIPSKRVRGLFLDWLYEGETRPSTQGSKIQRR